MTIIKTQNLTKKYGDFTANKDINLDVHDGEIVAIVGENGAGKTTLMNMLYGLLTPTKGDIFIDGEAVHFKSPLQAIELGLGMVHQHFKLVPSLSVYENVLLGIEITKSINVKGQHFSSMLIDHKKEAQEVQRIASEYQLDLDVKMKVKDLSVGAKQRVEILKMLYRNVRVLILDEPTAVLTPQEVNDLIVNLKTLKKQGKTIIMITHKLREVMAVSDRVSVLKQGQIVGTVKTKDTSQVELSRMMVGRDVLLRVNKKYPNVSNNQTILKVSKLETRNVNNVKTLNNVSFTVKKGEILGVAGVEGNGQSELAKVLSGLMLSTNGQVLLDDVNITNWWPKQLRNAGLCFIPEDRYKEGLCGNMTITKNLIAGNHWNKMYFKNRLYDKRFIKKERDELQDKYDIRMSDKSGNVESLSGGNAQKIIVAREFSRNPKAMVISQPTRGVDVGSIEYIHSQILDMQNQGTAILLISSELSEVMSLSDRIIVMYKGEIIGEVDAKGASKEEVGLLMAGIKDEVTS
jgi:simple sugar transport system ATP-binding protein